MAKWLGRKKVAHGNVKAGKVSGKTSALPWYRRNSFSATDAVLTGLGIGIAVAATSFPWYVFFNQEKFGVAALRFEGSEASSAVSARLSPAIGSTRNLSPEDLEGLSLDYEATGSLPPRRKPLEPSGKQAFPASAPNFALVHVANGRALIRDANGLWIVERGSILPDNSRVVAIESRDGSWILRTSENRVVEIARDAGGMQASAH